MSRERRFMVQMRDGTRLATDVYRPQEGGVFLVVVERLSSCRTPGGRSASEGDFNPFFDDAAEQPWSTGQVGMAGVSFSGDPQWLPAKRRRRSRR